MAIQYSYVGPKNIVYSKDSSIHRVCLKNTQDIFKWIEEMQQQLDATNSVIATYIVDIENNLWITDRHCEHVICAHGEDVLAAGEITFTVKDKTIEITYISNQSTGYCPEPKCWIVVKKALDQTQIIYPSGFNLALVFRRCSKCLQTNIVKNSVYECAVCNTSLSLEWNYGNH